MFLTKHVLGQNTLKKTGTWQTSGGHEKGISEEEKGKVSKTNSGGEKKSGCGADICLQEIIVTMVTSQKNDVIPLTIFGAFLRAVYFLLHVV